MKNFKANTLPELRRFKGIKIDDISKVISKQSYYNWIEWLKTPKNKETIEKFCNLFWIDRKTFDKLLKETLKLNK